MDIKILKDRKLILLECLSGSKAYGLDTPDSDTDIRGIFYLPKESFYGFSTLDHVHNASNDISYSELGKVFDLLAKSNPTMIELLNTQDDAVIYKSPLLKLLDKDMYLSRKCKDTFAGYAYAQIKKARGLKKKVLNPMEAEKKTVLDFCYVQHGQGAIPLRAFLGENQLSQEYCGLVKIAHMPEVYGLYYGKEKGYKGIFRKTDANEVSLSSVGKGEVPLSMITFNKSGYSSYCKDYKEYWDWVKTRNESRYENTISHGKNYDAKNMMHTFRLIHMAAEIAQYGEVFVKRPDRGFLLKIKNGHFEYNYLLEMAEEKIAEMDELYVKSTLPDAPDLNALETMLIQIRSVLYK